jgi:hypothetical protein
VKRSILGLLVLILVAGAVLLNVAVYQEYFGDGPPYFGRRENMDKWTDPRGWLVLADAGLALVVGCVAACWKGRR